MRIKSKLLVVLAVLAVAVMVLGSCSKKACPAYSTSNEVEKHQNS
ncbi:MAG: hypothetical protein ACLFNU_05265 [Bacteroidales bacterium]